MRLRRFRAADAPAFATYRSDPEIARYQSWDAPFPLSRAADFVAEMAQAPADVPGEYLQLAVVRATDDLLIGDVAFRPERDDPRTVDICFTIAPVHQGQGHASEAVRGLLGWLFHSLGKHRVTASCDARNLASKRVLEAVGMRNEGHLVEASWWKGEWSDDLLFAILSREWTTRA